MEKTLNCIMCPIGCTITVSGDLQNPIVTGNSCPRGKSYAIQELTAPKRTVTALFPLEGGGVVPCKTSDVAPKEKIFDILKEILAHKAKTPVKVGDVLIENVCGTGVDIIATADK